VREFRDAWLLICNNVYVPKNYLALSRIADPFMMPHMQVDKGAIKFILSGANVMCPGLTSPGARMTKVEPETVVVSFISRSVWYMVCYEFYILHNRLNSCRRDSHQLCRFC
jgi:predicted RNA-binding protein (TIGR00451 family)